MYNSERWIGVWVRKRRPGKGYASRTHLVESVINGELVTNCGRRLTAPGYVAVAITYPMCKQCEA